MPVDVKNPDYVRLHSEYKNLVDFMLGSFMQELQISPAKFEMACLEGRIQQQQQQAEGFQNPRAFHQRLFQQIWAANDIRIFVRMMIQRNVELQLQALDLIERRQSSEEGASASGDDPGNSDGADLTEFNEQGGDDALIEANAEELLETLKLSSEGVQDAEENPAADESGDNPLPVDPKKLPPLDVEQKNAMADKFERLNLFFEKEKVAEEEVKQRQDYLRAQRDKILQIKKRTRARQLNETVMTTKSLRPSSARAAQKILSGEDPEQMDGHQSSSLMVRRVLAKRLREEVVDGKKEAPAGDA